MSNNVGVSRIELGVGLKIGVEFGRKILGGGDEVGYAGSGDGSSGTFKARWPSSVVPGRLTATDWTGLPGRLSDRGGREAGIQVPARDGGSQPCGKHVKGEWAVD